MPNPVIGVDEVGRGCLAGPVYAAAVILTPDTKLEFTDSKLLSAKRREELSTEIHAQFKVSIAFATVAEIEKLNILHASLLAMKRAVEALKVETGHVLVDGHMSIPGLRGFLQSPIVKGDLRAQPVAAASIVAKVARDKWMHELDEKYPGYGFAEHKGYATESHRRAIQELGPCTEHRALFAGVREHMARIRSAVVHATL